MCANPSLPPIRSRTPENRAPRGGVTADSGLGFAAAAYTAAMERPPRPDSEASLGDAQADNPPDDADMIEPDADPLDTDVEDADLFLGDDDDAAA